MVTPSCSLYPNQPKPTQFINNDPAEQPHWLQIFQDGALVHNADLQSGVSTPTILDLDLDDVIVWAGVEYTVGDYEPVGWCRVEDTTTNAASPTTTTHPTEVSPVSTPTPTPLAPPALVPLPEVQTISTVVVTQPTTPTPMLADTGVSGLFTLLMVAVLLVSAGLSLCIPTLIRWIAHK